jgi:hypothetical protein
VANFLYVSRNKRKSGADCTKGLFGEKAKAKVAIFRQWICTGGQNQAGVFLKNILHCLTCG